MAATTTILGMLVSTSIVGTVQGYGCLFYFLFMRMFFRLHVYLCIRLVSLSLYLCDTVCLCIFLPLCLFGGICQAVCLSVI